MNRVRAEHAVMAVVLPLTFLVWGSLTADGRLTLGHFREALGSRLYVQALQNSLVLGLWTAALSVAIGLPLAWASSRTDAPAACSAPEGKEGPSSGTPEVRVELVP